MPKKPLHITAVGCSFTYAQRRGWADKVETILKEKYGIDARLYNSGHPGAGNKYIAEKIPGDMHHRPKIDLAMVMWSGLTRKEVVIDRQDSVVVGSFSDYGYVRWTGQEVDYVFSGGFKGSWETHPMTREVFGPLYKISNERSMAHETLVNILNLQNFLKYQKIPYVMSSYVNYWTNEERVADLDYGIAKFKDLDYLVKQIDFSKWVFANSNKDGIYELAKNDPNGLEEDGWHPEFHIHEQWADLVVNKLETLGYLENYL